VGPKHAVLHGLEQLEWASFSPVAGGLAVRVAASGNGLEQVLGSELPSSGSLAWDTTGLADGVYTLHAAWLRGDGSTAGEATQYLHVNNSGLAWQGGWLSGDESWSPGLVHVVAEDLIVPSGRTLTITAGAVVKFGPGVGVTVASGGKVNAPASASEHVILTSLADDTAGGDTNADGSSSAPRRGD
jgi:hypothetical protein